jgi:hypothetical protein
LWPYCVYADRAVELLRASGRRARRLLDGLPEWRAADVIGLAGAMWLVAGITLISGILAAVRMDETVRLSAA